LSPDGPPRLFLAVSAINCRTGSRLDRVATRHGLLDILDAAAAAADLPPLSWLRGPADTELAELLVDDEPVRRTVDRFLAELDAELFRHNVTRQRTVRLRARLAIHCGQSAGQATRLADAVILHEALRLCPEANLGVLVSLTVFDDTATATNRPEWLRKVSVTHYGPAWLLMPGQDVHALSLQGSGYPVPAARARSS
jgi:hypothetical protein